MTRTLTIKGRTGEFDSPSFLLSENENLLIRLRFVNEVRNVKCRLVVRHGDLKKVFTGTQKQSIELSAEWLKQNAENLDFSLVLLNATETAVIKDDYQIEPLKLETVNGNFAFSSLVQSILSKQLEQDEKIDSIEKKLKEYEDNGVPIVLEENE